MLPNSALEEVKRDLRSMLISEKGGVPLKNIQKDYEMLSCNRLPFREFGFNDVQAFMRSIPDVAREMRGSMGEVTYFAVCDESTSHIQRLVSSQKSKKKKPAKFSTFGRGGGRGGRGVGRGAFRGGGRGGALLPKPNIRPDYNAPPAKPRPPQNMRGGGRWQRGGIPRVSSAADPSIGQSGDWRNKGTSTKSGFSTFINGQNQPSTVNCNNWGHPAESLSENNSFSDGSGGDWDKENQSSPSSSVTSPLIRNLRIGVDNKGNRTINKDVSKEIDLREQINNSRAKRLQNTQTKNSDDTTGYCVANEMEICGDLRQKLNEMRNSYLEDRESSSARDEVDIRPRGRGAMSDVWHDSKTQESESSSSKKGNFLSRQTNNKGFAKSNVNDLPPRFRKQQQGGNSRHDGGFPAEEVKAEPISPIQHTETVDDTTVLYNIESKNWVPPENGKLYLEAFHNYFQQRGIPAPTIIVNMGRVEKQKGFYGQTQHDNILYYPLEILHTEEEAQQNVARAFCLKNGITLPVSSSLSSPSEIEAIRKKIYNVISESGVWAHSLPSLYKETYKENLDPNFMSFVRHGSHLFNIEEPFPSRHIIYKVPEAMVKLAEVEVRRSEESSLPLQLPPLPDIGLQFDVMFSYAYSGDEIYFQKSEHENLVYQIEAVLLTLSEKAAPSPRDDLSKRLIAACYEGGWYRAEVLAVESEQVSVSFVDYGNRETVARNDVRILPNDKLVTATPPLAIPCCLHKPADAVWRDDVASVFESLSEAHPILSAKVIAHKANLCVMEMFLQSGEDISSKFIQQNGSPAIPPTPSSPVTVEVPVTVSPPTTQLPSPPPPQSPSPPAEAATAQSLSPTTAAVTALSTPEIQQVRASSLSQQKKKELFAEDPEPLCLPDSGLFGIHVCRVLSESSILLRIVDDEYSDKLDELENEIAQNFLSWPVPRDVFKSNVYACVISSGESEGEDDDVEGDGNKFYRARVLHKEENGMYECYLLDHGDHEMVQKDNLREIDSTLNASLSYQAILASLHSLDALLPDQRAIAVEALIKLTMTDCTTFMAMRHDSPSEDERKTTDGGDGSHEKTTVDPVVINRVRKILTCLKEIVPAKVVKIYMEVYKESLDNVEDIINHIPGYGYWKKSLEVELMDTSQEEDLSVNMTVLAILEEAMQLQAEGKNGNLALYNYFGGPDSGSASIDGSATADSKSIGDFSQLDENIRTMASSIDHQLSLAAGGASSNAALMVKQQKDGRPVERVCNYAQQQADSVAAVAAASMSVSSQRQQQLSPSSAGRSLYTWSTNVNNVKDAEWISSRPLTHVDEVQSELYPHQSPLPPHHQVHHGGGGTVDNFPPMPKWYEFDLNVFSALFILHAESPSDFVAIPYDMRQPLLQMEESLAQYFSVPQEMAGVLSTSCLYCANKDGVWHRTLYLSSIEHLHRVMYPDYHQFDTVTQDQLIPLPTQFYTLPFLGRKMGLGAISPTSQDWPESVKFWFIQNTRHKSMYGLIWDASEGDNNNSSSSSGGGDMDKNYMPKPLKTQLVDTSGQEDVILDDVLCDKGWARHTVNEWKE